MQPYYTIVRLFSFTMIEGRATPSGTSWQYEYYLKDHLGNTRVIFSDTNNDGEPEIIHEADYYPFGMRHDRSTTATNHYLYNGKELNTDLGLDWYDYGFRWYDAELGRFPSVDPIADRFPFASSFNYAENSPIANIDLWGLQRYWTADEHFMMNEGKDNSIRIVKNSDLESSDKFSYK